MNSYHCFLGLGKDLGATMASEMTTIHKAGDGTGQQHQAYGVLVHHNNINGSKPSIVEEESSNECPNYNNPNFQTDSECNKSKIVESSNIDEVRIDSTKDVANSMEENSTVKPISEDKTDEDQEPSIEDGGCTNEKVKLLSNLCINNSNCNVTNACENVKTVSNYDKSCRLNDDIDADQLTSILNKLTKTKEAMPSGDVGNFIEEDSKDFLIIFHDDKRIGCEKAGSGSGYVAVEECVQCI